MGLLPHVQMEEIQALQQLVPKKSLNASTQLCTSVACVSHTSHWWLVGNGEDIPDMIPISHIPVLPTNPSKA